MSARGVAGPAADALRKVERRLQIRDLLRLLGLALALGAVAFAWSQLAGPTFGFLVLVVGGALIVGAARRRPHRRLADVALLIERCEPGLRNLLITAVELEEGTLDCPAAIRERVFAEAAQRASMVRPRAVVLLWPATRLVLFTAAASLLVAALPLLVAGGRAPLADRPVSRDALPPPGAGATVRIRVSAPAYLRMETRVWRDPDRLDVIAGAHVTADAVHGTLAWTAAGREEAPDRRSLSFEARLSGYLTHRVDGAVVRVIPVTVRPDAVPHVVFSQPAGDLRLAAPSSVGIQGTATDDFGLSSAELRFTRVSGSGEQFEFTEGVVPLAIERVSPKRWSLAARLPLPSMRVAPGDMVVYRLAARDARGLRGEGRSDALIVEIAAPGAPSAAGAQVDPTEDRFALSQQMVLLKLRRLHAGRRSMSPASLSERALGLAAEQGSVRALFIFMLGGEIEDEEVEAAHSHEIQEGRLEDSSRRDLVSATNHMSLTEKHLTDVDTGRALPEAEAAVAAVQRAFGRQRYFLRTTPLRMRIDQTRRYAGDRSDARDLTVDTPVAPVDVPELPAIDALVRALERPADRLEAAGAAAQVLRVDPASADLQRTVQQLQSAGDLSADQRRAALEQALSMLVARVRARRPGRLDPHPLEGSALRSAWAEEWRATGREP